MRGCLVFAAIAAFLVFGLALAFWPYLLGAGVALVAYRWLRRRRRARAELPF